LWDIDGISAGSAIKAKEFIAALRRRGHIVHLEWRTPQPQKSLHISDNIRNGLKPHMQKYVREPRRLAGNFQYLVEEFRILKKQAPDIFFPRLTYDNFSCLLLSKWLNIPMVVEADCPPTHEWKSFFAQDAFRFGELSTKLEVATLNQADAVITQSDQLREYYVSLGIPAEKIVTIPNAADLNKFQPTAKDRALVDELELNNQIVIGWLGAGVSWTGRDIVCKTAELLLDEYPSICFLMLGSQENMEYFRNHFHSNGYADRIILPGFVSHDDIPRYLSCMDIVLAPYPKLDFFYASSMKLFEYMAAGKAIVATRIGQIAEVIQEGRNGFLYEADSFKEMYQKVKALILSSELRNKVSQNARKDVEGEWNWDRAAEKMEHVFEDVLNKKKLGRS
jgi:glycosyltransferase involved in cell wall biosynthesis